MCKDQSILGVSFMLNWYCFILVRECIALTKYKLSPYSGDGCHHVSCEVYYPQLAYIVFLHISIPALNWNDHDRRCYLDFENMNN